MIAVLDAAPWWAWSIVANLSIAVIEYLNRMAGYPHVGAAFLHTGALIVVAQVGLFYAWRDAPSFWMAWAFFTMGNVGLRVTSAHFFVGERLTMHVAFGVALVLLGGHFVRLGIVR